MFYSSAKLSRFCVSVSSFWCACILSRSNNSDLCTVGSCLYNFLRSCVVSKDLVSRNVRNFKASSAANAPFTIQGNSKIFRVWGEAEQESRSWSLPHDSWNTDDDLLRIAFKRGTNRKTSGLLPTKRESIAWKLRCALVSLIGKMPVRIWDRPVEGGESVPPGIGHQKEQGRDDPEQTTALSHQRIHNRGHQR